MPPKFSFLLYLASAYFRIRFFKPINLTEPLVLFTSKKNEWAKGRERERIKCLCFFLLYFPFVLFSRSYFLFEESNEEKNTRTHTSKTFLLSDFTIFSLVAFSVSALHCLCHDLFFWCVFFSLVGNVIISLVICFVSLPCTEKLYFWTNKRSLFSLYTWFLQLPFFLFISFTFSSG